MMLEECVAGAEKERKRDRLQGESILVSLARICEIEPRGSSEWLGLRLVDGYWLGHKLEQSQMDDDLDIEDDSEDTNDDTDDDIDDG